LPAWRTEQLACDTHRSNGFFQELLVLLCPSRLGWAFVINSYENPHLPLRTSHHRFCFAPSRHTGTGKSLHRQIQNSVRGQRYSTLESFLYTQGADPEILGFYKMMQSADAGEKISKIELVDLTPEAGKKATPMDSPTGWQSLPLTQASQTASHCDREKRRQRQLDQ
jgi:hypothetical protein